MKTFADWALKLKPSKKAVKAQYKVCRVVAVISGSGSVKRFLKHNSNPRLFILREQ
jgi:hypothetical protein